jgi:hypothetical protein
VHTSRSVSINLDYRLLIEPRDWVFILLVVLLSFSGLYDIRLVASLTVDLIHDPSSKRLVTVRADPRIDFRELLLHTLTCYSPM